MEKTRTTAEPCEGVLGDLTGLEGVTPRVPSQSAKKGSPGLVVGAKTDVWRSMATIPKDGTHVDLVVISKGRVKRRPDCFWTRGFKNGFWVGKVHYERPIAWMPIPDLPEKEWK